MVVTKERAVLVASLPAKPCEARMLHPCIALSSPQVKAHGQAVHAVFHITVTPRLVRMDVVSVGGICRTGVIDCVDECDDGIDLGERDVRLRCKPVPAHVMPSLIRQCGTRRRIYGSGRRRR